MKRQLSNEPAMMSVNNTWLNYPFVSQYVMADGRRGFSSKVLISFAIDKLLFKKKKMKMADNDC